MILSDISVKRPVFATVLSLLLVVVGLMSYLRLPLRELPNIDPPVVSIDTQYRGASAAVIDSRITKVLEDAISGIEGIKVIESSSQDGRSQVSIEFNLNRDIESAANDVRDAVARAANQLPDDLDPPQIAKVDADTDVMIWFNLTGKDISSVELADYAKRNIVDRLSVIDGVSRVRIGGPGSYAMRVWIDRQALAARQLTVGDIEAALQRENVELPAGQLESRERDLTVRVERAYLDAKDFAALPLKRADDGHIITLSEVARVERAADADHFYFRRNGVELVGVGIEKQSTANTLDVARAVKAEMEKVKTSLPPGMEIHVSTDTSVFIEQAIHEVYVTLAISMALVIVVIYLFLGNVRSALIPAVTVPVCLISSFSVLAALGLSINLLTLLALVLAIGLVVDDAIIVLENIQRRMDEGEPPLVAAYRGAGQVGFAVVATTTVLIAVFTPIMFLEGDIGRLFTELAVAIGAAVGISGFVALTLTPMMCSKILRPADEHRGLARIVDTAFNVFRRGYRGALARALAHPKLVMAIVAAMFVGMAFLWTLIPSELAPEEDRGVFYVDIRGPEGAGFDYSVRQVQKVEKILEPYIESGEIARMLTRVPGSFSATRDNSTARAVVALTDWSERSRSASDLMSELAPKFSAIPGANIFATAPQPIGRGRGQPVQFVLGSSDVDELVRWRDAMLERARTNPGLIAVDADYKETKPQLRVEIDRNRAADLGVSIESIGHTLETMLGSRQVTRYLDRGEEYDVILEADLDDRRGPNDLTNIFVRSDRSGTLIPISNLVRLVEQGDAATLKRLNRLKAITIQANLAPGYTLGEALTYLERTAREVLPPTAVIDYRGASRTFKESSNALYFTFAMALVIVFLVLSAQFESFIHPLVILLTVPLAVVGGLVGLYLSGSTLNIYSQIGIVILIGLAAKNGILIVEFANQLRDEGVPFEAALQEAAATRLRPIIMTSLSTAFGALPLVLAGGAGEASRFTIGIVIVSGVLVATFMTIFVIPAAYLLIARGTQSPQSVSRQLDRETREFGAAPGE